MIVKIYIGIDDTDNLETRGTGYQARSLGLSLMNSGLLKLLTVTRHQLLVDERIPFTSHNSSACLLGETSSSPEEVAAHCREFLLRESAPDADPGLCIVREDGISDQLTAFGLRAKYELLTLQEAMWLAKKNGIYLEGFLNAKIGMIGALAAVGLRFKGNDGRLLWMENLRETCGVFRAGDYLKLTGIDRMVVPHGMDVDDDTMINITQWCRPVMSNGLITLFLEKTETYSAYEFQSASKEFIKSISE